MLHEKYTIAIHSFVDLITNSSTELYIQATDKTITSIKALIDNILKLGGSELKCDDLFTVELDRAKFEKYYGETYEEFTENDDGSSNRNLSLLVKCRDENNSLGKVTATVLSNLTGLFNIEASYDS